MVYELIKFEQALANEKIIRLYFSQNNSPFTKECSLTELEKIQGFYRLWNGVLITQDFDNLLDVVRFLNETMVRERLCKMNGRQFIECYAPVVTEKPEVEVTAKTNSPIQHILDETKVGEVYRLKQLRTFARKKYYYLYSGSRIFRQHFKKVMHGSYIRTL